MYIQQTIKQNTQIHKSLGERGGEREGERESEGGRERERGKGRDREREPHEQATPGILNNDDSHLNWSSRDFRTVSNSTPVREETTDGSLTALSQTERLLTSQCTSNKYVCDPDVSHVSISPGEKLTASLISLASACTHLYAKYQ